MFNKIQKVLFSLIFIIVGGIMLYGVASAVTHIMVPQGGTGAGTYASQTILIGSSTNPIATTTYTIPQEDGTANQILKTDGSGTLTFQADDDSGGGGGDFATTTADYWLTTKDTADLTEGTNLYYTDARVAAYVGASTTMAVGDWNEAFGWGDHSIQNYFDTDIHTLDNVPDGSTYKLLTAAKDGYIVDWTSDQGATNIHSGNYTDTNTNANTECSGGTTYMDGDGNCDDISSVYEGVLTDEASLYSTLSDVTQFYESGDKVGDADTLDTHDTSYFVADGCSNCLNATEIEDIYLLNTTDTLVGQLTVDGSDSATSTIQGNIKFENNAGSHGCYFIYGATTTLECF